jgi:glutaredoxin
MGNLKPTPASYDSLALFRDSKKQATVLSLSSCPDKRNLKRTTNTDQPLKQKVDDVSEGYIENGRFFWGEDSTYPVIKQDQNTLVIYFEDPNDLTRVGDVPEECLKRLKDDDHI